MQPVAATHICFADGDGRGLDGEGTDGDSVLRSRVGVGDAVRGNEEDDMREGDAGEVKGARAAFVLKPSRTRSS